MRIVHGSTIDSDRNSQLDSELHDKSIAEESMSIQSVEVPSGRAMQVIGMKSFSTKGRGSAATSYEPSFEGRYPSICGQEYPPKMKQLEIGEFR